MKLVTFVKSGEERQGLLAGEVVERPAVGSTHAVQLQFQCTCGSPATGERNAASDVPSRQPR